MGSKTSWHPYNHPDYAPSYILANGAIANPPSLEISGGGRRVRLADDPDIATYASDLKSLLLEAAKLAATDADTFVMAQLVSVEDLLNHANMRGSRNTRLDSPPDLGRMASQYNGDTVAWLFEAQEAPEFKVLVALHATDSHLQLHYCAPATSPDWLQSTTNTDSDMPTAAPVQVIRTQRDIYQGVSRDIVDAHIAEQWNLPTIDKSYDRPLDAWSDLYDHIQNIESLSEIPWPDLSGTDHRWLTLVPVQSNLTGDFLAQLQDYLNNNNNDSLLNTYKEFVHQLRLRGITVDARDEHDFAMALTGDEHARLANIETGNHRHDHALYFDIIKGTLAIACSHEESDGLSQGYEVARLKAEISGELDAFLKFTEAWLADRAKDKAR